MTAALVCNVGSLPDNDGLLLNSSAAVFIGGSSSVTASTGFPLAANTPTRFPTTGAESVAVYAIPPAARRQ